MWYSAKTKPQVSGTEQVLQLLLLDGKIVDGWYDALSGHFYQFSSMPIHNEVTDWKKK